jgi:magnesium-transporting ATPase (P-type)
LTRIKFKIVTHELSSVDLDFPQGRIGIIRDKCRFIGPKAARRRFSMCHSRRKLTQRSAGMSVATSADLDSGAAAWHAISADEVVTRLATNGEKGLDAVEASTRLRKYGPNRLPEGKKRGPFMRFLAQFNNILVYVLLGAGFTKLMLSLWVDAGIIFGVVILNALLGFIQEGNREGAGFDSQHVIR